MTAVEIMNASNTFDVEPAQYSVDLGFNARVDIAEQAYKLCKEYLKGRWETVSRKEFKVTVLGGGLTNKLYVCRIPQCDETDENCPTTVVLRIYGLIIQDFTAQIQESVVFSILSERKVGPRLYAVFPGGRLEQYIQCRTLCTEDLPDPVLSRHIAKRLARYHMMMMPVNKQPTTVMNKLQSYYDNLRHVHFQDDHKTALLLDFLQYGIGEEINYVKNLVHETGSPVVFCHNDLQEGNLLHVGETIENPIQLIDFEYSCYNFRGFDTGNHFCEWMFDYSEPKWPFFSYKPENYPTRQQQEIFIKSYLDEYRGNSSVCSGGKWEVDFMVKEANRFTLLSHLFWALWSVIQAQISDIGFGYMEYAIARMDAYVHQKAIIESTQSDFEVDKLRSSATRPE